MCKGLTREHAEAMRKGAALLDPTIPLTGRELDDRSSTHAAYLRDAARIIERSARPERGEREGGERGE